MKKQSKQKEIVLVLTVITIIIALILAKTIIVELVQNRFFKEEQVERAKEYKGMEFSYDIKNIEKENLNISINVKDEENGINSVELPNGQIIVCNKKNKIAIDYVIKLKVEYKMKIVLGNGEEKERSIFIESTNPGLISIDKANNVCVKDDYKINDVEKVKQCLFDGVTKSTGSHKGVLLIYYWDSYLDITVNEDVEIYAYCGYYEDSQGGSEGNVVFHKYNGDVLEDYKVAGSDLSGNQYLLVTLPKGRYRITADYRYVCFNEWIVQKAKN